MRKTFQALALPLAARSAPSRTKVSAGTGGKRFSSAEPRPRIV
jgi:hypothetical protein